MNAATKTFSRKVNTEQISGDLVNLTKVPAILGLIAQLHKTRPVRFFQKLQLFHLDVHFPQQFDCICMFPRNCLDQSLDDASDIVQ